MINEGLGWPRGDDPAPPTLAGESMNIKSMGRFCISRHNKNINMVLKDLSAATVPLQELWNKPWHKDYQRPITPPVLPSF